MVSDPLHDVEALASQARVKTCSDTSLRLLGFAGRTVSFVAIGMIVLLLAGFGGFILRLEDESKLEPRRADAIVALTGGSERISDAVELLAEGRGKRLLITGVNRTTSPERLAATLPSYGNLFDCCIDMDYQARNTVGNAIETKRWAEQRNIRSLIVVTSSYHMPRAMIELQRAMPDVDLHPHPVVPDRPAEGAAWRGLAATRVLATEYGKFLAAYVRASIFPQISVDTTATGSVRRKTTSAGSLTEQPSTY